MDGSNIDHSDSDSGDSWTILDHSPYGDDAPDSVVNNQIHERDTTSSNIDKDEDTDGISIISDSEPEIPSACEMVQDLNIKEESRPTEISHSQFISFNSLTTNNNDHEEAIRSDDDFLGNNAVKHKTYVHRRNKRLSTVLNVIMLGSVITAAGVALGHMWGARNECSIHTTPSVNKILSNLYKLQEENTYLRNKLKELTLINSLQMQHKKLNTVEKIPFKSQRCKKIYEEPLNSKNTDRFTKCIDSEINSIVDNNVNNHLQQPGYEKAFIRDVEKLKHIYQQNRSWLDEEVAKRMKYEEDSLNKKIRSSLSSITEEQKVQENSTKVHSDVEKDPPKLEISPVAEEIIQSELDSEKNSIDKPVFTIRKITYADSLKFEKPRKIKKREADSDIGNDNKSAEVKKKIKMNKDDTIIQENVSEEDFKKDDRFVEQKYKQEKKKRDRQKLHKKQKRRNKYEQWEMKGGYMKDYDDFSTTSFQDVENILKNSDGNPMSQEYEKMHIHQLTEMDSIDNINSNNKRKETLPKKGEKVTKNGKIEVSNWYDERAALRTEARKRLEHELFGETSPKSAKWYFRRMQKREQCRAKSDNSTHKKFYKRSMNFKTKQ